MNNNKMINKFMKILEIRHHKKEKKIKRTDDQTHFK